MAYNNIPNYKKIYAMKREREERIKKVCPSIPYSPGIYAFYRVDENGIKRAYVGQAVKLCERCASHLAEYDHIALSLKKHKFYSKDNPFGWKLAYKTCKREELDEMEIATIKNFADDGYQMYNITTGGQGKGKSALGQYKASKGYRDGLKQGRKNASREVANLFEKHLNYSKKSSKPNKIQDKALEKFEEFLNYHKMPDDNGDIDTDAIEKSKYGKVTG